jgi:hypothetical protein
LNTKSKEKKEELLNLKNMNYRLKKDLPNVKAGKVFKIDVYGTGYFLSMSDDDFILSKFGDQVTFKRETVENSPEWFEPIENVIEYFPIIDNGLIEKVVDDQGIIWVYSKDAKMRISQEVFQLFRHMFTKLESL